MKNKNKNKYINLIIGYILNVLLVIVSIIILIGMYYMFQLKIMKNEYANIFGYTFFEVATGSMNPTMKIGDVIIVKITKDVQENDIIVYREENNFITHRLIEKNGDSIKAKGDANNSEDKPVGLQEILGKVIMIIPKVGIWRKIIMSPEVIGLIIILITIFSITFIYNSKSEEKNE